MTDEFEAMIEAVGSLDFIVVCPNCRAERFTPDDPGDDPERLCADCGLEASYDG